MALTQVEMVWSNMKANPMFDLTLDEFAFMLMSEMLASKGLEIIRYVFIPALPAGRIGTISRSMICARSRSRAGKSWYVG